MAKRGKPRSRIPVRVGGLEATLDAFKAELLNEVGIKTAVLLNEYDRLKVAPLRVPWYRKLALHVQGWWAAPRPKPPAPPPSSATTTGADTPNVTPTT